jgi:hypothetical protein
MSTQKQIDANRRKGVKHGLCAKTLVLEGESERDYHTLFDSLEAEHRPATPTEVLLVSQLALSTWRLRRLCHIEAGFFTLRYLDVKDDTDDLYTDVKPSECRAVIILKDSAGPNALANFHLHESRLERSMYRALHELQRLQARRAAAQNEMANQTQSTPEPSDRRNLSAPKPRVAPPVPIRPKPKTAPETPQIQPRIEDDILVSVGGDLCSIDG